jgi:pectate lyase
LPARGPPTDWGELVQVHDDRDVSDGFQASPDELPVSLTVLSFSVWKDDRMAFTQPNDSMAPPLVMLLAMALTFPAVGMAAEAGGLAAKAGAGRRLPSFPGAEGWGSDTPGGRGGKVMVVTNLNPDGPGSLQEACAAEGPRIVVFAVSGVINGMITIENPNITIAGQTAPGAGITIAGILASKEGINDVVIRHIRVRPMRAADTFAGPEGEKVARRVHACGPNRDKVFDLDAIRAEPNEFHDAASLNGVKNLVVDHCSFSWGSDEVVSVCRSVNVTFQWCAIEEGAIKEGRKYSGYHNFGMFSAYNPKGCFISVHHSLFAHNSRRCPSVRDGFADLRNNVIYNARGGFDHDAGGANDYNYINNYFRRGPNSTGVLPGVSWGKKSWWAEFRSPGKGARYCVEGNLWDDQPPPLPPWVEDGSVRLKEPTPAPEVTTQTAKDAYELVLAQAGAWPHDAVTSRTIEEVRTGTGDYGRREPKGGLMEGLTPVVAPLDTDNDGMPNDWEKKNGLDPAKDDSAKVMPDGYTAIEVCINERADALVGKAPAGDKNRSGQQR